jgi:hypothetical protein
MTAAIEEADEAAAEFIDGAADAARERDRENPPLLFGWGAALWRRVVAVGCGGAETSGARMPPLRPLR